MRAESNSMSAVEIILYGCDDSGEFLAADFRRPGAVKQFGLTSAARSDYGIRRHQLSHNA